MQIKEASLIVREVINDPGWFVLTREYEGTTQTYLDYWQLKRLAARLNALADAQHFGVNK